MPVTINLKNDGRDDAFDVVVYQPLPEGLEFIESSPPPDDQQDQDGRRVLVWRWGSLQASDVRTVELKVKPTKAVPMDLVAHVESLVASKARTAVQEPKLKIDLVGPNGEVLRGSEFDFTVNVQNVGNGPAREVNLIASLTGGLQSFDGQSGEPTDARRFEFMIGDLEPGESSGPIALGALAAADGKQNCTIEAVSPDVVPAAPAATEADRRGGPEAVDRRGRPGRPPRRIDGRIRDHRDQQRLDGGAATWPSAPSCRSAARRRSPATPGASENPEKGLYKIYWRIDRLDKDGARRS